MVGDIKATFSQWINHKRDNKGKRPKHGQNQRDLGGGRKKNQQTLGGSEKNVLVKFIICEGSPKELCLNGLKVFRPWHYE